MLGSKLLTEIDPELDILGIVKYSQLKMEGPKYTVQNAFKGPYFVGFWDYVFRIMVNGFTVFLEQ